MRLPTFVFLMLCCLAQAASPRLCRADARSVEARALFEQGVAKTSEGQWEDAAILFERSRELVERPATVLNLIVVYDKLDQPLRVVWMVQRLLQIADPVRHESERKQALSLEARAYPKLAPVKLSLVPPETSVLVDGEAPVLAHPQQLLLAPGEHALQLSAQGYLPQSWPLSAVAGQPIELRAVLTPAPAPGTPTTTPAPEATAPLAGPEVPSAPRSRAGPRTVAALGFAVLAGALSTELLALSKARSLSREDAGDDGYQDAQTSYQRTQKAVIPLAAVGGLIAASGLLWATRGASPHRRRGLAWGMLSLSVVLAGVGAVVWSRPSAQIGQTTLEAPTTSEPGMLLVAGALPGLTWSIAELLR